MAPVRGGDYYVGGPRPCFEEAMVARSHAAFRFVQFAALIVLVTTSCATPASSPSQPGAAAQDQASPGRKKVLTLALRTLLDGFSISASPTLQGGGYGYVEIHSQALFTADKTSGRPIPRLLAEQPTQDNGGLRVTPDGKMTSTYKLRRDVRWADGAPFTAQDLMFTFSLTRNRSMPIVDPGPSLLMESASAPDNDTFIVNWGQPYYQADALGLQPFWPLPAHLLEADYNRMVGEQKDVAGFMGKPFWTAEYLHIGPFKLADWQPGVEAAFDAVDNYFLGRPKVDRIVVKQFGDSNTLLANILSGVVDMTTDNVLPVEQSLQLQESWSHDNGGTLWFVNGPTFFLSFQFERSTPGFPGPLQDLRVRQALYQAIDRDTVAEAVLAGIPDRAAHSMLTPENPLYAHVQGAWKQRYPYDPAQAAATLEGAGWKRGAGGMLTNSAGERMSFPTWTTMGQERKLAAVADSWRKVGVDAGEFVIPAARTRDTEFRQSFPAVEVTARGNEDVLLTRLESDSTPTSANHFSGNNRGHWTSEEFDRLATQYRATLREADRGPLIKQLQDIMLDQLPIALLNYEVTTALCRKGVYCFQNDAKAGADAGRIYGTYSRNAHEWDVA